MAVQSLVFWLQEGAFRVNGWMRGSATIDCAKCYLALSRVHPIYNARARAVIIYSLCGLDKLLVVRFVRRNRSLRTKTTKTASRTRNSMLEHGFSHV